MPKDAQLRTICTCWACHHGHGFGRNHRIGNRHAATLWPTTDLGCSHYCIRCSYNFEMVGIKIYAVLWMACCYNGHDGGPFILRSGKMLWYFNLWLGKSFDELFSCFIRNQILVLSCVVFYHPPKSSRTLKCCLLQSASLVQQVVTLETSSVHVFLLWIIVFSDSTLFLSTYIRNYIIILVHCFLIMLHNFFLLIFVHLFLIMLHNFFP